MNTRKEIKTLFPACQRYTQKWTRQNQRWKGSSSRTCSFLTWLRFSLSRKSLYLGLELDGFKCPFQPKLFSDHEGTIHPFSTENKSWIKPCDGSLQNSSGGYSEPPWTGFHLSLEVQSLRLNSSSLCFLDCIPLAAFSQILINPKLLNWTQTIPALTLLLPCPSLPGDIWLCPVTSGSWCSPHVQALHCHKFNHKLKINSFFFQDFRTKSAVTSSCFPPLWRDVP